MDLGWDIPQSGSGAGSMDQESSSYQDTNDWYAYENNSAWDNSSNANEHDTFWGANHNHQQDEVFGAHENQAFGSSELKSGEVMNVSLKTNCCVFFPFCRIEFDVFFCVISSFELVENVKNFL